MSVDEKIEKLKTLLSVLHKKIVPEKTALIVIDMQKYQVREEGAEFKVLNIQVPGVLDYFVKRVENVVEPNLVDLIPFCRDSGIKIIYTKYCSFSEDGSDLPPKAQEANKFCKKLVNDIAFPPVSHPLSEIIPSLKPELEDLVIVKNTSGTFISTRLDSFLKNMGIETLIVTGVVTHFCVISTAREASDLGFNVVIVEDCCAGWTDQLHDVTLTTFALLFGNVTTLKKIKRTISKNK